MELVLTLLGLLDKSQFLVLYEKVVLKKSVVTWPEAPGDEEKKARLEQLYLLMSGVGFERNLVNELQRSASAVRSQLKRQAPNGILPSNFS